MEVIPEWETVIKSQCKEIVVGQTIPGLDLLKAYGNIEEPLYVVNDVVRLFGIEQRKMTNIFNEMDEGDDYMIVEGQKYLTTEGIIALAFKEKNTITKYIRKVVKNCVKILRSKYPKILEEVLEKTKAENVQLHASFQAEIAGLYDQVGFITRAKHEVEDDLEETKTIMHQKEAEVLELRNRERALMSKVIQSHTEDLREPDKLLLDSLVAQYAKKLYIYNTTTPGNWYISDRENKSREIAEIIPLVSADEYKRIISDICPARCDDGTYAIDIEDIKELVNEMRRKEADIKALNACSAFLYTASGQDFIDKHVN